MGMQRALVLATTCIALMPLTQLSSQATGDEARLVVGVAGGWIGGAELWSVARQPVITTGPTPDEMSLERRLRSNIAFSGQVTYFPRSYLGITGELGYLGLGTTDRCSLVVSGGDPVNEEACAAIEGNDRSASAVGAQFGVVLRMGSRNVVQPYLRAQAGLALVPRSTVELSAVYGDFKDAVLPIYESSGSNDTRPLGSLSVGIATSPRLGYQLRLEARGTYIQLPIVAGAAPMGNLMPVTENSWIFLPSITVGIDIVLEKSRGRRY
jgi:hypothetical protein